MKKLTTHLTMLLLAVLALSFSACEPADDADRAATLNGTWHGSLGQYYSTVYGDEYAEWETEFRFENYNGDTGIGTSGQGVEIDYDPRAWSSRYKYYDFRWEVTYGNIYLHYANGDELVIRNYRLSDSSLVGQLETYNGKFVANLNLGRTSYWPWGGGYAKSTRASEDTHAGQKRNFEK